MKDEDTETRLAVLEALVTELFMLAPPNQASQAFQTVLTLTQPLRGSKEFLGRLGQRIPPPSA